MSCLSPTLAFLDVGAQEMVVILVVALLIFGGKLPDVARNLGKTVGDLRRSAQGLTRDLRREMDDIPDPRDLSPRNLYKRHILPREEEEPGPVDETEEAETSAHPEDSAEGLGDYAPQEVESTEDTDTPHPAEASDPMPEDAEREEGRKKDGL